MKLMVLTHLRLIVLCCCSVMLLPSIAFSADGNITQLGLIVNVDNSSITVFNPVEYEVLGAIDIPESGTLLDVSICPLSNGTIIGAVSDIGSVIHIVNPFTLELLDSIPVSLPAVDISCCGDYLLVSDGAFIRQRPLPPLMLRGQDRAPVVVDLIHQEEVFQTDSDLPGATANACSNDQSFALTASLAFGEVDLLDFDINTGQLSTTFTTVEADDPINLSISPDDECASVYQDNNTAIGFALPDFIDTEPVSISPGLVVLGGCSTQEMEYVRSGFSGMVDAFERGDSCQLGNNLFSVSVNEPVLTQFPGVDTIACGLKNLFITVDGGDNTNNGDMLAIVNLETGRILAPLTDSSINGPLSVAVLIDPTPIDVPSLNLFFLTLLGVLILLVSSYMIYISGRRTHKAPTR